MKKEDKNKCWGSGCGGSCSPACDDGCVFYPERKTDTQDENALDNYWESKFEASRDDSV